MSWGARFDDPIALANGRKLLTLKDAATHITNLPKKDSDLPECCRSIDRGAIRHDLFPQANWTTAKARVKGCYRLGVLTIGSKDIVLEYTVPMASP